MATAGRRKFFLILAALALLLPPSALAQSSATKENKEAKDSKAASTRLRIEVTAGEKPEPVDNASVYVKYQHERALAKDRTIEMNLKTNREGIARAPGVPRGKVLIQVIAPGWKTFGQWYELTQDEHTIKINLQKPPRWY